LTDELLFGALAAGGAVAIDVAEDKVDLCFSKSEAAEKTTGCDWPGRS